MDDTFQSWCRDQGLSLRAFEKRANPKRILQEYLSRDQKRLIKPDELGMRRAEILRGIAVDGPVRQLDAWQKLVSQVREAMCRRRPRLRNKSWPRL